MDYRNLAEEELKLRIAEQFFPTYDCTLRPYQTQIPIPPVGV